jgi:hypothetical protein
VAFITESNLKSPEINIVSLSLFVCSSCPTAQRGGFGVIVAPSSIPTMHFRMWNEEPPEYGKAPNSGLAVEFC